MKKKINELEALLKKAIELADEISDQAADNEFDAKNEYRTLRHSKDEVAEDKAYEMYRMYGNIKNDAESLKRSLKGLRNYNGLFK